MEKADERGSGRLGASDDIFDRKLRLGRCSVGLADIFLFKPTLDALLVGQTDISVALLWPGRLSVGLADISAFKPTLDALLVGQTDIFVPLLWLRALSVGLADISAFKPTLRAACVGLADISEPRASNAPHDMPPVSRTLAPERGRR